MSKQRASSQVCRSAGVCLFLGVLALSGCGGGSDVVGNTGTDPASAACDGSCASATSFLTTADVQQVLAQGIAEAQARGAKATLAVVDRVGNVLAVYRMGDAAQRTVLVTSAQGGGASTVTGGLEGIQLPTAALPAFNLDPAAAIAKAITGAYLSSEGNAFSTRTANQIVQDHFNPGEQFQPSGPLFGVQFSQLACSDFSRRFDGIGPGAGPQRSPLGLSADPGGFPLYKGGTVVGGVGVIADGVYGVDADIGNVDDDLDEAVALAATSGFAAPANRRGDQITVDGKTLRFTDIEFASLKSSPASAPALSTLSASVGALIAVPGYTDGVVHAGTAFGQPASGIRADGDVNFPGQDAFVFVDAANAPRFAPRAGTDGAALGGAQLKQDEVLTVLRSALDVANQARAQIRQPLSTPARVTIAVVDTQGAVLGMVRGRDAPVFGADVSLQKARSAALFSSADAATFIASLPDAKYLDTSVPKVSRTIALTGYVSAARSFFGDAAAFGNGQVAFTDRALGNIARPTFPDGIDASPAGPFSKPVKEWSPFSTGIQLDLAINAIQQHVLFVAGITPAELGPGCAGVALSNALAASPAPPNLRAANGLQIFPGSVPIYRGGMLVGAVGVSGDGVDQDDMIAFLGLHRAGVSLNGAIGNAPVARRADTLTPQGTRLRYVQCPQSPFLNSSEQNVCEGK